ncbi:hypothetical protein ABW20_dc0105974 [Dactylellina cionopaga]|nr:hypothetical protein ABW20_dc0105974 [Dactylellina cionopaga]
MALPSPTSQPAYPHQQGPLIPSSVFRSDRELQELVNRRDMRISSTHDLAEFLRSSRPEDYSRPLKAIDDLALDAGHRKISFKFLKSASKDFLSPRKNYLSIPVPFPSTTALPEKVRPEKTSKGNSYLAIQVDYTPGRSDAFVPSIWTPASASDDSNRNSIRNATSAEYSSDRSNYRDSIASETWKEHAPVFQPEYDSLAQSNTRGMSRWMRNSSGSELSSSRATLLASTSRLPDCYSSSKLEQQTLSTFPTKYARPGGSASNPANIIALAKPNPRSSSIQRRYSSDSTPRASPLPLRNKRLCSGIQQDDLYIPLSSPISSTVSSESPTSTDSKLKDHYTSLSNRPARPGPPPSRDLPSLPEGHGDAINLASKIRAAAAARSSIGSQISLTSEVCSLKSRRNGTTGRTRSERELSVKARKIKDIEELRNRRSISQVESSNNLDFTLSKPKKSSCRSRKNKPDLATFSPITVVYEAAPDGDSGLGKYCDRGSGPEARRSISSAASSEALPSDDRQSLDSSIMSPQILETSTITTLSNSIDTSPTSLEARIKNMERRNFLLEQALLAVLRGAICMDNSAGLDGPGLSDIVKCLANISAPT